MPLLAEGEFALGGQHLEQALYKPSLSAKWGSLPSDLDIYASLVDMAMLQRDLAALRKYGPSLEIVEKYLGLSSLPFPGGYL